jgi:hypothetical protein
MKRLEAKMKQPPDEEERKFMAEREGYDVSAKPGPAMPATDSGFAKARKDIDWIDPSKK